MLFGVERKTVERWFDKWNLEGVNSLSITSGRGVKTRLKGFEEVIVATGVVPRALKIEGSDAPQVLSYAEVLRGAPVGGRVAVIGAGGIGFDVSEFLLKPPHQPQPQPGPHHGAHTYRTTQRAQGLRASTASR